MIDIRLIRTQPEWVAERLASRGLDSTLLMGRAREADEERRQLLSRTEELRADSKRTSKRVDQMRSTGADASEETDRMRSVRQEIRDLEVQLAQAEQALEEVLLRIPNLPDPSVPVGADSQGNVEVRRWGEPREFDFAPCPHWEVGEALGILDFERCAKLAGSRFSLFLGEGALLERALINFMLDLHTQRHGFKEVSPPYLAARATMQGTGQVPALEDDMFRVEEADLFLIPTAEVPLTALHAGEILSGEELPRRYTAYSACFRREAGAAGKETRGLIRRHQFDKVELVMVTRPEESMAALEELTRCAEAVLEALEIPYRTLLLCTGDMGVASAKTYDLEAWCPGLDTWLEISSCSNCTDYQARRANIRFRREPGGRLELVHTLNGSGIAVGRTFAAVLENCQQADGTVLVPEVLRPYMRGLERIVGRGA